MIFIYLSLIFILTGLSFWIFGAMLHKKSLPLERKKREKQQEKAQRLGDIAKVILIVAALLFVAGFMMINGVKMNNP
jgi:hypothetical protein